MLQSHTKTIVSNLFGCEQTSSAAELIPIGNRIKINSRGFWHTYHIAISVFTLALLADCLSIVYFMSFLGVSAEIHPIVCSRYLCSFWPYYWANAGVIMEMGDVSVSCGLL
jgi:hypothetical protein